MQPRGKSAPHTFNFILSPHFSKKKNESTTFPRGRVIFQSWAVKGIVLSYDLKIQLFKKEWSAIFEHQVLIIASKNRHFLTFFF